MAFWLVFCCEVLDFPENFLPIQKGVGLRMRHFPGQRACVSVPRNSQKIGGFSKIFSRVVLLEKFENAFIFEKSRVSDNDRVL